MYIVIFCIHPGLPPDTLSFSYFGGLNFPQGNIAFCTCQVATARPFRLGGYFWSLWQPLAASRGLPWPLAPSGGLRRPLAASGGLWRPPGALRRPPAHSSASFCARCSPEPSGTLLRPPAPFGLRRLPAPSGALRRSPAPSSTLQHPPVASADLSPVEGELQRKSVYYEEGSEGGRGQCSTCIALPKIFWT